MQDHDVELEKEAMKATRSLKNTIEKEGPRKTIQDAKQQIEDVKSIIRRIRVDRRY